MSRDTWNTLCKGGNEYANVVCARRDRCARYVYNMLLEAAGGDLDVVRMMLDENDNGLNCGFYFPPNVPPVWWDDVSP